MLLFAELGLFGVEFNGIDETLFTGDGPPDEHETTSISGGDAFGVFKDDWIN